MSRQWGSMSIVMAGEKVRKSKCLGLAVWLGRKVKKREL